MNSILSMLRVLGTIMLGAIPVMFLWNGVLADAITVIKPINYFQAIGVQFLAILLQQSFNFYYIRSALPGSSQGEIKP